VQAVLRTPRAWSAGPVIWPMQAGGGPWTTVPQRVQRAVQSRRGAIGGGGGATNEYFVIERDESIAGLAEVEKYHVDLLYACARAAGRDV
jgi:hypothetical protein